MNSFRIPGAASTRLPTAFLAVAALTGCHPGSGSLGGCLLCGNPQQVNLEGSISGLVGSGLTLANNSTSGFVFSGAGANQPEATFAFAPDNTGYHLTVQKQPTSPSQTCVVTNGTGTAGTTAVTNIEITCTTNPPRFAYVVNRGSNNISAYTLDVTTGALALIAGSPFAAGKLPVAIAVDPTGKYAYVVNKGDSTISAYLIDRSSGALTAVGGSPFAAGTAPTAVAIDSTSSLVYVTNGGAGTLSGYAITAGSGALTAVPGSPFTTGALPSSLVISPDQSVVFVANQSDDTVSIFGPLSDGGLTPNFGPTLATGTGPVSLAIDITAHLYVANITSNTLTGFAATNSEQPTAAPGSPYATGSMPASVAIDPLDQFVYVANQGANNVSAFALDSTTGALTPLAGSPFTAGNQPSFVAVDPTGAFAYVVNAGADTVSVYVIDAATGALNIGSSSFATGAQPTAMAISD